MMIHKLLKMKDTKILMSNDFSLARMKSKFVGGKIGFKEG